MNSDCLLKHYATELGSADRLFSFGTVWMYKTVEGPDDEKLQVGKSAELLRLNYSIKY
jgi:hypothetical protein